MISPENIHKSHCIDRAGHIYIYLGMITHTHTCACLTTVNEEAINLKKDEEG